MGAPRAAAAGGVLPLASGRGARRRRRRRERPAARGLRGGGADRGPAAAARAGAARRPRAARTRSQLIDRRRPLCECFRRWARRVLHRRPPSPLAGFSQGPASRPCTRAGARLMRRTDGLRAAEDSQCHPYAIRRPAQSPEADYSVHGAPAPVAERASRRSGRTRPPWTNSTSAPRLQEAINVRRHDVGGCEGPTGRNANAVAVAIVREGSTPVLGRWVDLRNRRSEVRILGGALSSSQLVQRAGSLAVERRSNRSPRPASHRRFESSCSAVAAHLSIGQGTAVPVRTQFEREVIDRGRFDRSARRRGRLRQSPNREHLDFQERTGRRVIVRKSLQIKAMARRAQLGRKSASSVFSVRIRAAGRRPLPKFDLSRDLIGDAGERRGTRGN